MSARASERAVPLLSVVRSVWAELPGLIGDRVHLLSLELQRAGLALAQIVAMTVAATILGLTAWLTFWVGAAIALLAYGLHIGWVLALVLVFNLAAASLALRQVRALAPLLALPATLRQLTGSAGVDLPPGQ